MHKAQIFGYFLISFLVGVFVGSFVPDPMRFMAVLLIIGAILLVVLGWRDRAQGILIGGCVLMAALGMFRYGSANFDNSVLTQFANVQAGGKGVPVTVVGYIDEEPTLTSTGNTSIVLKAKQLTVPGQTIATDEKVLLTVKPGTEYKFGQQISVTGPLLLPDNFAPGFDYVSYLKNKDIRVTMVFPKIAETVSPVSLADRAKLAVYGRLFAVKIKFESSVISVLPEPYASYINGVLLGAKQNIPKDLTDDFNKTGTTHILAISGYNITIIAEAMLAVLVFFVRRRAAFWLSVIFIILFTILTGAGASVVRAAVMGLLLLAANGYGRLYDARNSILLAAGAMVWLNPLALKSDVGFQLSFLAVLGLMYVYPIFEHAFRKFRPKHEFWTELKDTFLMTISAQLAVAPLLIYYFKQFSLVSLPANLLVLPLMPLTMLFGFLAGLGGLIFHPLGQAFGAMAWLISFYQLGIIRWLGGLSWSAVSVTFSWFALCICYLIILFAVSHFRIKNKINATI